MLSLFDVGEACVPLKILKAISGGDFAPGRFNIGRI